jgi:lysine-N-methylase
MARDLPLRPRLAGHVLARRHIVDGELRVVLHDLAEARLVRIGPREWGLLAAADGTRDLEGILLAAAREGAHARPAALEQFLEQLHAAGMLEDGADDGAATVPAEPERPSDEGAASRKLEALAGFTLTCDGRGSCCRLYASIVFGPLEATRARALLPQVLDGGERHERVFMPERGSAPTGGAVVTLRDGRCAYLGDDDRCALHAIAGPAAKPVGCATFPATFTDDGEVVRVSVAVECACVLASVGREGGEPIVPPGAVTRADLHETLSVRTLPDLVQVTPDRLAPRADFCAWSRRVAAGAATMTDAAASLVSLGAAVASGGLLEDPGPSLAHPDPIARDRVRPWIEALYRQARARARQDVGWRSPRDLARRATGWIAATTEALLDPDTLDALLAAPVPAPLAEAFYVRAVVHGHELVRRSLPLSLALHDRAVRLLVARAIPALLAASPEEAPDPAAAHPLALVEAMLRGHGLDAYALNASGS